MDERRYQAPIRTGCYVEFVQIFKNGSSRLVAGTIIEHGYTDEGYHFFVVSRLDKPQWKTTVSGAQIYRNLLYHEPGERSRIDQRRAMKRGVKKKRQLTRLWQFRAKKGW